MIEDSVSPDQVKNIRIRPNHFGELFSNMYSTFFFSSSPAVAYLRETLMFTKKYLQECSWKHYVNSKKSETV